MSRFGKNFSSKTKNHLATLIIWQPRIENTMGFIESSVAQLKFQTGIATTTLTNCHPYGSQVAFKIKLFFRAAPWRFAISHPQGILGPGESILVEFKFKGGRKRRSLPPPVWIKGAFVVIAAPIANAAIPPSQSRLIFRQITCRIGPDPWTTLPGPDTRKIWYPTFSDHFYFFRSEQLFA